MSDIKTKLLESADMLTAVDQPWEVVPKTIGGIDYKVYKHAPDSLKALIDHGRIHAENTPDAEFLIYADERWTFVDYFEKS